MSQRLAGRRRPRPGGRGIAALAITAILVTTLVPAGAGAGDVRVSIVGSGAGEGDIRVAAFRSGADLDDDRFAARAVSPATGAAVTVVLGDLEPGEYGFVAFQDRDGDGVITKNLIGIPKEPYGFSNGARGRMGPPSFEDARVRVPAAPIEIEIELQ